MWRLIVLLAVCGVLAEAQQRLLFVTHSAGYRHDSIPAAQQAIREIGARAGFAVDVTENLSVFSDLQSYRAIAFFTSGELALTTVQRQILLNFVSNGGGFLGFHSATDTLYTWPAYGDLIGARFDGHPWTQQVKVDVEDPEHPATRHLGPSFTITEEIYQFRDFSRNRVRVLMTLDTSSVDMTAPGVNRTDEDFALAWTHMYGLGRVFYSALGHFEETWRDGRFQKTIEQALLWATRQMEGEAAPRAAVQPAIAVDGVGNAATMQPAMTISPGSLVSIYGSQLTSGATMTALPGEPNQRLAGTRVLLNGEPSRILFASPRQLNIAVPLGLRSGGNLAVQVPRSRPAIVQFGVAPTTPGVFASTIDGAFATLWATGLGSVQPSGSLSVTTEDPRVWVNNTPAHVSFSGLAPGWPGLYQVNVKLPPDAMAPLEFRLQIP